MEDVNDEAAAAVTVDQEASKRGPRERRPSRRIVEAMAGTQTSQPLLFEAVNAMNTQNPSSPPSPLLPPSSASASAESRDVERVPGREPGKERDTWPVESA